MFRSKRRSNDDLGCQWEANDILDRRFDELFEECDFYIVKHWFLCCATAPCIEIFFEKLDVERYLRELSAGGDALEIWSIDGDKMIYIAAKMPDENGLVPIKGCAY